MSDRKQSKGTKDDYDLKMLSGSTLTYYVPIPCNETPVESIGIFHVTAVSASWKLQTTNHTMADVRRYYPNGSILGVGDLDSSAPSGSDQRFWYTEPSASIPNSTGSAGLVHTLLHIGNLGSRFAQLRVDVGSGAPAGMIMTASIRYHGKE